MSADGPDRLRDLELFLAVAEELHFARAAERCGIAPPHLSHRIKAFERSLGVELFWRSNRQVELSDAGRVLREDVQKILSDVERATRRARLADAGSIGELRVSFVPGAALSLLPDDLRTFQAANPELVVQVRELSTVAQEVAILNHDVDVGYVRPIGALDLDSVVLQKEDHEVVMPLEHPWMRQEHVTIGSLHEAPFIGFNESEAPLSTQAMGRALQAAGVAPNVVVEVSSLSAAVGLVAAGFGVTVVSTTYAAHLSPTVGHRKLAGHQVPTVPMLLAWRSGEKSAAVMSFVDHVVRRHVDEDAEDGRRS
jgi:DNA-binding transcriptional LysR family regulator